MTVKTIIKDIKYPGLKNKLEKVRQEDKKSIDADKLITLTQRWQFRVAFFRTIISIVTLGLVPFIYLCAIAVQNRRIKNAGGKKFESLNFVTSPYHAGTKVIDKLEKTKSSEHKTKEAEKRVDDFDSGVDESANEDKESVKESAKLTATTDVSDSDTQKDSSSTSSTHVSVQVSLKESKNSQTSEKTYPFDSKEAVSFEELLKESSEHKSENKKSESESEKIHLSKNDESESESIRGSSNSSWEEGIGFGDVVSGLWNLGREALFGGVQENGDEEKSSSSSEEALPSPKKQYEPPNDVYLDMDDLSEVIDLTLVGGDSVESEKDKTPPPPAKDTLLDISENDEMSEGAKKFLGEDTSPGIMDTLKEGISGILKTTPKEEDDLEKQHRTHKNLDSIV